MSGENNDSGISEIDINNSDKRLSKTEGYVSQAAWSNEYFSNRISGLLLAFIIVFLFFVWIIGAGELIKYIVSVLFLTHVLFVIVRRRRLKKLREKQLSKYRQLWKY